MIPELGRWPLELSSGGINDRVDGLGGRGLLRFGHIHSPLSVYLKHLGAVTYYDIKFHKISFY